MTALFLILILSLLAILGVVLAGYLRIKKKIGLPPSETQQIRQRAEEEEPVAK